MCVTLFTAFRVSREASSVETKNSRLRLQGNSPEPGYSGFLAVLLLVSSPIFVRYSHEARMYTQASALLFLSSWLLLRCLRTSRSHGALWSAYILTALCLGYTHYFGLLAVLAQAL